MNTFLQFLTKVLIFAEMRNNSLIYLKIQVVENKENFTVRYELSGAEGGNRTHTLLPAADFESATSTNSITSASEDVHIIAKVF